MLKTEAWPVEANLFALSNTKLPRLLIKTFPLAVELFVMFHVLLVWTVTSFTSCIAPVNCD
jgi:hypothetical protein